ncbi:sensor histidine kinase [Amycolatopsis regifaucium]|uniref:histidine kinase n=1 Tax=Amycolatopsis regifaucium TaxID=546365 RepID=A0A154MI33_9PSEU|nr:HAMP domain-containing sensor histidine kinase [Amycolatopsis regifaucium]KZB84118.1 histidine kinase [Amycolatopsis regifaucium]OKA08607.1 two-component sensor histidine kinase [Amycolatopsis regifaucium]SFJ54588.1 two-component system, OmpR family, sensor histidine kinase MtrB [Amycolatopsis regifaucium]
MKLRSRLVVTFVLVSLLSAATATVLAYDQAREAILERASTSAVRNFHDRVSVAVGEFVVPPDQLALNRLAEVIVSGARDAKIVVRYQDLVATAGGADGRSAITAGLRDRVRAESRSSFQRVEWNGAPWLVVGTPVAFAGSGRLSGVEVFEVSSLQDEQDDIAALLTSVRDGVVPVVAFTAVLALLAAGTVLRPVRRLARATRRLAGGRLETRVPVKGRDELADLARDFNETADALQASVAELREQEARARRFVADVSHELRTPLAAMTMVSSVLDEDADELPPDTAHAARTVSAETAELARLVDDLIEISRFDAQAATLTRQDIDVAEVLRATLSTRGWTDRVETRFPTGVRARLDRRRLDVIVANLVGNALRHGAPPVTVVLRSTAADVLVEVADRGPGLTPEAMERVFERFYKADTARTRSEGSGLGMAIAQENARLHGGVITVDGREGGGAVFGLRLPRDEKEPGR